MNCKNCGHDVSELLHSRDSNSKQCGLTDCNCTNPEPKEVK